MAWHANRNFLVLLTNFCSKLANNRSGFTLIELSIVLVIIGLIVGGVLVGQDLIRSSQIRATVSQFEKLNTSVNTFKLKYNGLPGDLKYTEAAALGFYRVTHPSYVGQSGYGDGDGLLRCGSTVSSCGTANLYGEPFMFWRHLSDAQMIDGNYGASFNTAAESGATTSQAVINSYLPASKLGRSTILAMSPRDGRNYFAIAGITAFTGVGSPSSGNNNVTGLQAYQFDNKIDDGLPSSGGVIAIDGINMSSLAAWTTVTSVVSCVSSGEYIMDIDTAGCSLRIQFK